MILKTRGVRTTHPDYDKLAPQWRRCSDTVDGQDAMHKRRTAYLPKLKDEDEASYEARLKRSDFYGAMWRTIAGLSGMAFRKPPTVEVPAGIRPMLDDVDLAGKSLDKLAKGSVEDMLEYGAFGLLVDHPPMPEGVRAISQAAAERLGLRPTIQYYEIESIINWRHERIDNVYQLTQVVLKESADIGADEFDRATEDRYRVLDLVPSEGGMVYRQRVFRIDNRGEDELVSEVFPTMRGRIINAIPFKIVGAMEEPPLLDLADANIAHYQVNSDYRHGLHFTGLPTLFLAGVTLDPGTQIYIGGSGAITAPDPNAKAQYVEFSGQGLGETREALRALEQRMAVLGARMLADESAQAETLGGTQIKRAGENSILAAVVIEVGHAIEWALGVFRDWVGVGGAVRYEINRDFNPAGLNAQELTALVGAVQAGKISDNELFDLLQRHDLIEPTKTFDAHQEEIASTPSVPRPDMGGIAA